MFDNTMDLAGNDLIWRNKPDLPVANEENRKLEETLREKKIEIEKLKVILENNINKGKNMREHLSDLCQTLSYKQQLYKSKEHELEMEMHTQKLSERECSRLEQEMRAMKREINSLQERQKNREAAIAEQTEKSEKLKLATQMDEEALLHYLEKSAQMEKDNMALLKYTSEDDSKISELGLLIERLSKESHEMKNALDEANTEAFIVQCELDRIQEEFRNAYNERNNLINNWEKVINQIRHRKEEIQKLSEFIIKTRDEQTQLKQTLKEQMQLLAIECSHNEDLERKIREKDGLATKLRSEAREMLAREEDLKAELSTIRNTSNYLLYQKQITENNLKQLEKQLDKKCQRLEEITQSNQKLENDIENLSKEKFDADHYVKELDFLLQKENERNLKIQKDISNIVKEILLYAQDLNDLKAKEKAMESDMKNLQAEVRNLNSKINALDRVRTKQESDMYEIESNLEKLKQRVKKMAGETTSEDEKRQIEIERSRLLTILDEKKKSLHMLTEELKIMMDKINVAIKDLEANKRENSKLAEKIKYLDFYISNSQKTLKCCVSRKEELLVQECLIKFQMKRYQKLLNDRNKSVVSLKKSKTEFEIMMKDRTEELKNCNDLLDAEIRTEEEERRLVKRKFQECDDKVLKLQSKYKILLDALGVSEPGESAEAEMLIKAEEEKKDLQYERDKLITVVLKNEEELTALKNTLWLIDAANEQFRQALYPPGISSEDNEMLKNIETEKQSLAVQMHLHKTHLRSLEDDVKSMQEKVDKKQNFSKELQDIIADREAENSTISKEIADLHTKIQRADRFNSRLSLDIRNKPDQSGIEEDIRIHLLREIRRTVSDLLFTTIDSKPAISAKVHELFQQAEIPVPSRARLTSSSRSSSVTSLHSRASSRASTPNNRASLSSNSSPKGSGRSSRTETISPSVVMLGSGSLGELKK